MRQLAAGGGKKIKKNSNVTLVQLLYNHCIKVTMFSAERMPYTWDDKNT